MTGYRRRGDPRLSDMESIERAARGTEFEDAVTRQRVFNHYEAALAWSHGLPILSAVLEEGVEELGGFQSLWERRRRQATASRCR